MLAYVFQIVFSSELLFINDTYGLIYVDGFLIKMILFLDRFEPDMLAFSGCYYGGGDKERYELAEIRKRWATLPVRLLFFLY